MATFQEVISQTKEAREARDQELAVADAKVEMGAAIAAARRNVISAERAVRSSITIPFNPARYVEATRDLEDAQNDLAAFEAAAQTLALV